MSKGGCVQWFRALRSKGVICSVVSLIFCCSIKIICSAHIRQPLFFKAAVVCCYLILHKIYLPMIMPFNDHKIPSTSFLVSPSILCSSSTFKISSTTCIYSSAVMFIPLCVVIMSLPE